MHDQVDKLDQLDQNFVNLVKFVMQFFYTRHNVSFVQIRIAAIRRSNALLFSEIYLVIAPLRQGSWIQTLRAGERGESASGREA